MGLGLIIAEKPSVGKSIAYAINNKSSRADGYFEGDKYITSFVFGHMYNLYDFKDYDPKYAKWNKADFPFIPSEFKYKARSDSGVKKQLKIIQELSNRNDIDHIIVATDFDMEGSLIGDIIIKHLKNKKPIKRLLINSHTPEEVRKGFSNLKDYKEMDNYIKASYCRQYMDQIIGFNYTVFCTLYFGNQLLPVGRVILPTLKLIYDRDMEISNFKPENYFELKANFNSNKQEYIGTLLNKDNATRFSERATLEAIRDKLNNKEGYVSKKEVKAVTEVAPLLFNLTDLQGHISSKHNIDADKTKAIAQELYELGVITYPRTASRHLDDSQDKEIMKVLDIFIREYPDNYDIRFIKSKRIFDSSKVDSHPALTPTYVIPSGLSKNQAIVYEEIKLRFISAFMPPNEYEQTTIITTVADYNFITKEKFLVKDGWIKLYKDLDKKSIVRININENDRSKIVSLDILDKQTEPPKKYTEKTLLNAMESCGKKVSEDDVEHILKGYTIGTADTRATTMKKINDLGYIKKEGKSLVTTVLGRELVEAFPVKELLDVDFTGRIQKSLRDIEKGNTDSKIFMDRMIKFITDNSKKFKDVKLNSSNNKNKNGEQRSLSVIGKCPDCGNDIIEGKKAYGCSNWKNGCKFSIWFNQLEKLGMKKINKTTAKKLLNSEKVKTKLHSSKTNKDFECNLALNKVGEKWEVKLDFIKEGV